LHIRHRRGGQGIPVPTATIRTALKQTENCTEKNPTHRRRCFFERLDRVKTFPSHPFWLASLSRLVVDGRCDVVVAGERCVARAVSARSISPAGLGMRNFGIFLLFFLRFLSCFREFFRKVQTQRHISTIFDAIITIMHCTTHCNISKRRHWKTFRAIHST